MAIGCNGRKRERERVCVKWKWNGDKELGLGCGGSKRVRARWWRRHLDFGGIWKKVWQRQTQGSWPPYSTLLSTLLGMSRCGYKGTVLLPFSAIAKYQLHLHLHLQLAARRDQDAGDR